jgi:hypothetical protein
MKTYVDLEATMLNLFLASSKLKNRLKKYWGTEWLDSNGNVVPEGTTDAVEVFKERFKVWPVNEEDGSELAMRKVTKIFGIYDSIKNESFDGLREFYLWFNAKKSSELDDINMEIIVDKFNDVYDVGDWVEFTLALTDETRDIRNNPWLGVTDDILTWDKNQIWQYVQDNYDGIVDSGYIGVTGDNMTSEVFGLYIPFDDGTNFEVEMISASVSPVPYHDGWYESGEPIVKYSPGFSVELRAKKILDLEVTSPVIVAMENEESQANQRKTAYYAAKDSGEADWDWVNEQEVTDEIWYKGRLRVECTNSRYLDRDKFAEVVTTSIDTGYRKKKTKWWKKILALVVVVVAIWLGQLYAVTYLPAAGPIAAVATTLGVASMILTVVQLGMSKNGQQGIATMFGKFVQVFSMISTVLGLTAVLQNITNKLAQTTLLETAKTTAMNAVGSFTQVATNTAATVTNSTAAAIGVSTIPQTALTTVYEFSVSKIMSIGYKLVSKVMEMRLDSARSDYQQVRQEYQDAQDNLDELYDKELNLLGEHTKWHGDELKFIESRYEVDYLYEGTPYNIGRPSFVSTGLNIIDKE